MIVTCPNCSTRFLVDDYMLGDGGRRVRCTNCRHEWFQEPQQKNRVDYSEGRSSSDLEPLEEMTEELEEEGGGDLDFERQFQDTMAGLAAAGQDEEERAETADMGPVAERQRGYRASEPEPGRHLARAIASWTIVLLLSAALAGGAVAARDQIVSAVPATADLYQLVGLSVAPLGAGLDIQGTTTTIERSGGQQTLIVEGEVVNETSGSEARQLSVPTVRVDLISGAGEVLDTLRTETEQGRLIPGETTRFRVRVDGFDPETNRVQASFTR
jgi:predicted Zn finger-like uncharacterized protein